MAGNDLISDVLALRSGESCRSGVYASLALLVSFELVSFDQSRPEQLLVVVSGLEAATLARAALQIELGTRARAPERTASLLARLGVLRALFRSDGIEA